MSGLIAWSCLCVLVGAAINGISEDFPVTAGSLLLIVVVTMLVTLGAWLS